MPTHVLHHNASTLIHAVPEGAVGITEPLTGCTVVAAWDPTTKELLVAHIFPPETSDLVGTTAILSS